MSPFLQTSFFVGSFFAISYSKPANRMNLSELFLYQQQVVNINNNSPSENISTHCVHIAMKQWKFAELKSSLKSLKHDDCWRRRGIAFVSSHDRTFHQVIKDDENFVQVRLYTIFFDRDQPSLSHICFTGLSHEKVG